MKRLTAVAAGAAAAAVTAGVIVTRIRARDDRLAELSKAELYERAKRAGIPGRSQMSRDELIAALRVL